MLEVVSPSALAFRLSLTLEKQELDIESFINKFFFILLICLLFINIINGFIFWHNKQTDRLITSINPTIRIK